MNYRLLTLQDSDQWHQYLSQLHPSQKDVYYTPEYYRLYEEYGDGYASCFVFEHNENIAIYPFLKNEINIPGVELKETYFDIQGAYGYNGVISTSSESQFTAGFYHTFYQFCKEQHIIAEFTRFHPILKNHIFSEQNMQVIFDRKTMYLELGKREYSEIFQHFQTTTKKQIKRAVNKHHVWVVAEENMCSHPEKFLTIYHEAMDRVGSIPYLYFNKKYFSNLFTNVPCTVFTAYIEDKAIAVIIALLGTEILSGHLGGAKTDYLHLSVYGLLYDEMIRYGLQKGFRYFHAGGGTTGKNDDPLFRFKQNFSDTFADFYIGKKIHNHEVYNEVVHQWEQKYPEKARSHSHILLKYRLQ
jgi:predicted N-acyltransferase